MRVSLLQPECEWFPHVQVLGLRSQGDGTVWKNGRNFKKPGSPRGAISGGHACPDALSFSVSPPHLAMPLLHHLLPSPPRSTYTGAMEHLKAWLWLVVLFGEVWMALEEAWHWDLRVTILAYLLLILCFMLV